MHKEQKEACESIKDACPNSFKNKKVLDVGSLDTNGTNRYLFTDCDYTGIDVVKGPNVDIVSPLHLTNLKPNSFDTIISTNALEHDMYYKETLKKMVKLLKPYGLLVISAANMWPEHGTISHEPQSSGSSQIKEWANYYKNINLFDLCSNLNIEKNFFSFGISVIKSDIIFWGYKKI